MSGIGEQLRKAREAKGLSISDIEKATKIQSRYLEAIENNDFDKLPGDFYVRAFIRQYAQIVGLDGKELLSQYQGEVANEVTSEVSQPAASSPAQEVHEEAHEEEAAPVEPVENKPARISASRPAKREVAEEAPKDAKWRKLVPRLALGYGIALLLLIGGMVFANMKKTGSSSQKENAGSSVMITSKKSSSKKSSSASSASSSSKKKKTSSIKVASLGGSSYRVTGIKSRTPLVVRSSKQSIYYYVSVDNVITNQGTLQSGEKHTETVKKGQTLIVYLGTDTGVTVTVGGKKIPFTPINGTTRLTIYLGDSSASASSSAASRTTSTNTNTNTSTSYSSRASSSVQSSASSRPAASSSSVKSSSQASSSAAPSSQSSAAPSSSAASSSKQQEKNDH